MNGIRRATWQQMLPGFRKRRRNRNTMALSLLALGIGAAVYGMTRDRNSRGVWQQATENFMDDSSQTAQAGMETVANSTDDMLDTIAQVTEETMNTAANTGRDATQARMD